MTLPELTDPVVLCLPDGHLNRPAVGYSRRPLHTTNMRGWGRNKRWEYWGIVTDRHCVGMTISNLDYLQVHQLYVYDRQSGQEISTDVLSPGLAHTQLPDHVAPLTASMHTSKLDLRFRERHDGTELTAISKRVTLSLVAGWSGDALCVVVPWDETRFQYTVKDLGRPLTGSITVDGTRFDLEPGANFGVLDRGRGRWPYSLTWNWAAGCGVVDGVSIGLQLGGKWTDGTGSTENALFIDGRMTYWPDPVEWDYDDRTWSAPWRIRGRSVDATLTPFHVRDAVSNVGVISSDTHQAFGRWSGWAADDDGVRYPLDGLVGWAEQAKNRW
ncbi:MAG: DUF2804 domain-containing protein [Actinomycetes bacterium]